MKPAKNYILTKPIEEEISGDFVIKSTKDGSVQKGVVLETGDTQVGKGWTAYYLEYVEIGDLHILKAEDLLAYEENIT